MNVSIERDLINIMTINTNPAQTDLELVNLVVAELVANFQYNLINGNQLHANRVDQATMRADYKQAKGIVLAQSVNVEIVEATQPQSVRLDIPVSVKSGELLFSVGAEWIHFEDDALLFEYVEGYLQMKGLAFNVVNMNRIGKGEYMVTVNAQAKADVKAAITA